MIKNIFNQSLAVFVFTLALLTATISAHAQWSNIGNQGFTIGSGVVYTALALDKHDKPFLAYSDSSNGFKASVMRYDTSHWVHVGPALLSGAGAIGIALAIDTGGKPYVAYGDLNNGGKLNIIKYNPVNNTWSSIGSSLSSGSTYGNISMIFDKHNNFYVAYTDLGNAGKVIVKKYNGSAFTGYYGSSAPGYYPSLALNKATDTVYVGFKDFSVAGANHASVINAISGAYVGGAGFTSNVADFTSLGCDTNNVLYLAFKDSLNATPNVMQFTGGSWSALGAMPLAPGPVSTTSIAVSKSDTVFVAYEDSNGYATVMEYSAGAWSPVGKPELSGGSVSYLSLALDTAGLPFVGYGDNDLLGWGTVRSYQCMGPYLPSVVADGSVCEGNIANLHIASASLNSTIQWQWYSGSCMGNFIDTANEINVTPLVTTTYYVRGSGWCRAQDSCIAKTVVVDTLVIPSVHIMADTDSVCPGTLITFTATAVNGGPNPIYQWKKNGQDLNATASVYKDSTLVNGDRISCVLFPSGCSTLFLTTSNVLKINLIPGPQATITANGPLTFCTGDSLTLQAAAGDTAYRWSTGALTQSITVKLTGTYSVTAYFDGCSAHSSVSVTNVAHNLVPIIAHNGPLIVCPGGQIKLDAGIGYTSYHWSTGDTTSAILVDTSGIFHVTVTEHSCVGNTVVTVIDSNGYQPPVQITTIGNLSACVGDTILLNAGAGFDTYLWNTGDTTQTILADSSSIYYVNVMQHGCQGSDNVNIIVQNVTPPTILSSDSLFIVCSGHTFKLKTNFLYSSYLWSTGETTSTILISDTGTYNVTVAVNGCTGTAVTAVTVSDFSRQPITLDTIIDTVGVTTIHVHPDNATNYLWQTDSTTTSTASYSTNADSLTVYCYLVGAKRERSSSDWVIHDKPDGYIYVIESLGGCKDTSAMLAIPCELIPSGIKDINGLLNLTLQPNPTEDLLNIRYQLATETELQITIMDMQGREIMQVMNAEKANGVYSQQVNVSGIASGVYLVNFESKEGRTVRKFVKQ